MRKVSRHGSRRASLSRRSLVHGATLVAASTLASPLIGRFSPALAAYPDRPIKLLVPFGPGGPLDVVARIIAPPLSTALGGATIVVENRAGASGNLGVGMVARADPDGYTILVAASTMVINTMLFSNLPYDIERDLTPIADVAGTPNGFAVSPASGINSIADFVRFAKGSKQISYAHSGRGTPAHLAAEYLKSRTGIEMAAVGFAGAGPAAQALLSGNVELCSSALPGLHPHISAGTLRGLAVTGEKRWYDLPSVPTMVEAGYPGFVIDMFNALFVPAKTPPEIAQRLTAATLSVLQDQDLQARLRKAGLEPTLGRPEQLTAKIARELPLWREIAMAADLKPTEAK